MSYSELYNFCQDLTPKISRNVIRDRILALTGVSRVSIMSTELDITVTRALYLSARNTDHRFVQQHGSHVIAIARAYGDNECWTRFLIVKELMHLFDDPKEATDTGDEFERLLTDFSIQDITNGSDQFRSELKCFWMALAALCPEKDRLEFLKQREAGHDDDYAIALKLKIPKQYVSQLFKPNFPSIVQTLLRPELRLVQANANQGAL